MGGGGGGRGLSPEQLRTLTERVKNSIAENQAVKCNVFISFVEEDLKEVNLLRGQAKNENSDIEFNDWSLKEPFDSDKAEYIRRGIRERIRQCSVTVVYLSRDSAKSKWVDWEIRESIRLGKGVVGMYKGSTPPSTLPTAVSENRILVVPWNQKELANAIKKESRGR